MGNRAVQTVLFWSILVALVGVGYASYNEASTLATPVVTASTAPEFPVTVAALSEGDILPPTYGTEVVPAAPVAPPPVLQTNIPLSMSLGVAEMTMSPTEVSDWIERYRLMLVRGETVRDAYTAMGLPAEDEWPLAASVGDQENIRMYYAAQNPKYNLQLEDGSSAYLLLVYVPETGKAYMDVVSAPALPVEETAAAQESVVGDLANLMQSTAEQMGAFVEPPVETPVQALQVGVETITMNPTQISGLIEDYQLTLMTGNELWRVYAALDQEMPEGMQTLQDSIKRGDNLRLYYAGYTAEEAKTLEDGTPLAYVVFCYSPDQQKAYIDVAAY